MKPYRCLNWSSASGWLPLPPHAPSVDLDASALSLLEDFAEHPPGRIAAATEARDAKALLQAAVHHWSCVVGGADELIGLITLRDLQSRHAVHRAAQLQMSWGEVPVQYLMTPLWALPLISLEQLRAARVGDIAETLRRSGREFLLVGRQDHVQGVISCCALAERTGSAHDNHWHPASFADIVQAVRHPDDVD